MWLLRSVGIVVEDVGLVLFHNSLFVVLFVAYGLVLGRQGSVF